MGDIAENKEKWWENAAFYVWMLYINAIDDLLGNLVRGNSKAVGIAKSSVVSFMSTDFCWCQRKFENTSKRQLRDHPFGMCTKFSEKLSFLTCVCILACA